MASTLLGIAVVLFVIFGHRDEDAGAVRTSGVVEGIEVNIGETMVGPVTLGSDASMTLGSIPGKVFNGKVSEIGRYAEFATQRDVTRGRQDIKTFRVKIKVGDTGGVLKPGMTVSVEIPKK